MPHQQANMSYSPEALDGPIHRLRMRRLEQPFAPKIRQ
jgi:hypothetical protein